MNNDENNSFIENDNNDSFDPMNQNQKSLGSRLASGIREANNLRDEYKNSTGLGDFAKNVAKHKIKDKVGQKVGQGVNNLGQRIISNKTPQATRPKVNDSVDQRKNEVNKKQQTQREKLKNNKNSSHNKAIINEQAFKKSVRSAMDIVAPGTGAVAEKMLDTPKANPAVEEARAASNPIEAVSSGTKKLVEIVVSSQLKKNLIITLLPIFGFIFIIFILVIGVFNKFSDSQEYFKGDPYSDSSQGVIISAEYEAFYNNVESSGARDRAMLVAVLTAYKDNDEYTNGDYDSDCTDEEIDNGTCDTSYDVVSNTSKRKMKKYIKKVTKKINESSSLDEGLYNDPQNTGSEFFRWLYGDFVEDYYSEYLSNLDGEKLKEKKDEIVHFIYLYYEDIMQVGINYDISYVSASCPNGVTVTGDGAGTYDLEEYVAGVVAHENYYVTGNNIEAMKAQAVAVRTFTLSYTKDCTKSIPNSTNAQTFTPYEKVKSTYPKAIDAAKETAGQVLTYNGKVFSAQYDGFYGTCSGNTCTATYTKIPVESKHTFSVPIKYIPNYARHYFGHGRGMSQYGSRWLQDDMKYTYDGILKYFYSTDAQLATNNTVASFNGQTALPVGIKDPMKWRNYLSRGYQKGTAKCYVNGSYTGKSSCDHLGVDFGAGGIGLGTPIYSIADGVVIKVVHNNGNTGYGNLTMIGHDTNNDGKYDIYSLYAHQSQILVSQGQKVAAGTQIGKVGNTGNSTGPHLHFEINSCSTSEKKCRYIDPSPYLDAIAKGNKI